MRCGKQGLKSNATVQLGLCNRRHRHASAHTPHSQRESFAVSLRDPIIIATIRGLLTAVGQALFTGLTVYQVTGDGGDAALVGALAFLTALGIRGGVEGVWDQRKGPRPVEQNIPPRFAEDIIAAQRYEVVPRAPVTPEPVDFDQPYHYGPQGGRHIGEHSSKCHWCQLETKKE